MCKICCGTHCFRILNFKVPVFFCRFFTSFVCYDCVEDIAAWGKYFRGLVKRAAIPTKVCGRSLKELN